jgi:hypothetical protein
LSETIIDLRSIDTDFSLKYNLSAIRGGFRGFLAAHSNMRNAKGRDGSSKKHRWAPILL